MWVSVLVLSDFLVVFKEIVGHEDQSHINSDLPFASQVTAFVTQTSLYLTKDRLDIHLALGEEATALLR